MYLTIDYRVWQNQLICDLGIVTSFLKMKPAFLNKVYTFVQEGFL
jgi:hypothetical protein